MRVGSTRTQLVTRFDGVQLKVADVGRRVDRNSRSAQLPRRAICWGLCRASFPNGMGAGELIVKQCNLASFEEIRSFAVWLRQQPYAIDYLVLNAAIKATPKW